MIDSNKKKKKISPLRQVSLFTVYQFIEAVNAFPDIPPTRLAQYLNKNSVQFARYRDYMVNAEFITIELLQPSQRQRFHVTREGDVTFKNNRAKYEDWKKEREEEKQAKIDAKKEADKQKDEKQKAEKEKLYQTVL